MFCKTIWSLSPAFNKMVSVNSQDFNLQLVDTAGQVSWSSIIISDTSTKLLVLNKNLICISLICNHCWLLLVLWLLLGCWINKLSIYLSVFFRSCILIRVTPFDNLVFGNSHTQWSYNTSLLSVGWVLNFSPVPLNGHPWLCPCLFSDLHEKVSGWLCFHICMNNDKSLKTLYYTTLLYLTIDVWIVF